MAQITFKRKPCHTCGELPALRTQAPNFELVDRDLNDRTLHEFHGKKKILITVPSLDTGVCSTMTKRFNEFVHKHSNMMLLAVSCDLPFAQKRFCQTENVHNALTLSMMRDKEFGKRYGLLIEDGPLAGLLARSVMVLDEQDLILYAELVYEITEEPSYDKAMSAV